MTKKINIYEEASRCLLCQDAPCTRACKTGDPARAIRAIRFDNHKPINTSSKVVTNTTSTLLLLLKIKTRGSGKHGRH